MSSRMQEIIQSAGRSVDEESRDVVIWGVVHLSPLGESSFPWCEGVVISYEPRKRSTAEHGSVHDAVPGRRTLLKTRLRRAAGRLGAVTRGLRRRVDVRVARHHARLAVVAHRGQQDDAAHASAAGGVRGQEGAALGVRPRQHLAARRRVVDGGGCYDGAAGRVGGREDDGGLGLGGDFGGALVVGAGHGDGDGGGGAGEDLGRCDTCTPF
ncbi:hypothetical protein P171DRAFT_164552 [Karstenula rhodostoma CBS 690.94]|uniref:Uncharacterized protein n=1 Tax=Karstenula rhodostoma CBS 690.94 TaxID=1392251 RepID=A0A9P4P578_9PLEO|nr:hypothetical protein P171DRAFT_164552 [Karstenula rhodostoma CBS 690.94]